MASVIKVTREPNLSQPGSSNWKLLTTKAPFNGLPLRIQESPPIQELIRAGKPKKLIQIGRRCAKWKVESVIRVRVSCVFFSFERSFEWATGAGYRSSASTTKSCVQTLDGESHLSERLTSAGQTSAACSGRLSALVSWAAEVRKLRRRM